jgi:uncharacterized delta-60 repeat protein
MKVNTGKFRSLMGFGAAAAAALVSVLSAGTAHATGFPYFWDPHPAPSPRPNFPLPQRPAPYWGEGAQFISIDPDQDDFFWGLDVKGTSIFVSGERGPATGAPKSMFVAKFITNGRTTLALDTTFGVGGVVDLNFSPYQGTVDDPSTSVNETDAAIESSRGVRVQADGRIVVVGMAENPAVANPDRTTPTVLVLTRLNTDGSVDTTFGTGGLTTVDVGGAVSSGGEGGAGDEAPWGLELDPSGRPLVSLSSTAETSSGRTDRDRYALRFTVNGQLDTTWGTNGSVSFDVFQGNNDNQRHGVALPNGGLLSTGYTGLAGRNQVYLAQFTNTGAFDPAFSVDGRLRFTPFPLGFAECYDAARLSDGSFVTTGYGNVLADPATGQTVRGTDAVEFRILADGQFDSNFGEHGGIAYNVNNSNDRGRSITALKDDTLVIVGTGIPAGPPASGQPLNPEDAMIFLADARGRVRNDFDAGVHRFFDHGGADEEFFNVEVGSLPRNLAPYARKPAQFVVASGYSRLGTRTNGDGLLVVLPVPSRHVR